MESTFALNVLQKLDHCFTITFFFYSIARCRILWSKIIYIHIGAYGKRSDGGIFFASTLYHFLDDFESTLPKPARFWGKWYRNAFRHPWWWGLFFKDVTNEAFREKGFVMWRTCFQYSLSRGRRCVECAFGILTAKWRLLNKAIETNVNKAERTVRCICWLHNIIIGLEGTTYDHSVLQETSQIVDPIRPEQMSAVDHSVGPQKEQLM